MHTPLLTAAQAAPPLPAARGPASAHLIDHLRRAPHDDVAPGPAALGDPVTGEDAALALYVCYELHYRGFRGVDEGWEWHPGLLGLRSRLEAAFCSRLVAQLGPPCEPPDLRDALLGLADDDGPSLSARILATGTLEQVRELAVHRSAYQLKEAHPHSFAIPRLGPEATAPLVAIQAGEYGDGRPADVHAALFASTLRALDLDDAYGAHLDRIPGTSLATVNLISWMGLHRRWRGALVGHLALFEMCSVGPMGRYGDALRRLGFGPEATRFYDVHVEADATHRVVALEELVPAVVAAEPQLAGDVWWGARALVAVEATFAAHVVAAWDRGASSLLPN